LGGAALLRRWRIDPDLGNLRDVERFALTFLPAAIPRAIIGMVTLLAGGLMNRSSAFRIAINWWASYVISTIIFTPFLLLFVARG
jgi:integral membrane sensor domain MASE1